MNVNWFMFIRRETQGVRKQARLRCATARHPLLSALLRAKDGGADKDRTCDLLNAIQALYQLSYDPIQNGAQSNDTEEIVKTILKKNDAILPMKRAKVTCSRHLAQFQKQTALPIPLSYFRNHSVIGQSRDYPAVARGNLTLLSIEEQGLAHPLGHLGEAQTGLPPNRQFDVGYRLLA